MGSPLFVREPALVSFDPQPASRATCDKTDGLLCPSLTSQCHTCVTFGSPRSAASLRHGGASKHQAKKRPKARKLWVANNGH